MQRRLSGILLLFNKDAERLLAGRRAPSLSRGSWIGRHLDTLQLRSNLSSVDHLAMWQFWPVAGRHLATWQIRHNNKISSWRLILSLPVPHGTVVVESNGDAVFPLTCDLLRSNIKGMSNEKDPAKIRFIRKVFIIERGTEVFGQIRPSVPNPLRAL